MSTMVMFILCKETGNIFKLPDEEALRIKTESPEDFEILDCGIDRGNKKTKLTMEEVEQIVELRKKAQKKEEIEFKKLLNESFDGRERKKFIIDENYQNLTRKELFVICDKVGIKGIRNQSREKIIKKINEIQGK